MMTKSNSPTVRNKKYRQLKCPIARRAYILYMLLEDIQNQRIRLGNLSRVYEEKGIDDKEVNFAWLKKHRAAEERQIIRVLEVLMQQCPLRDTIYHLGLGVKSWAFFVSRCSPFQYYSCDHLIRHLGNRYTGDGKKYKNKDGQRALRIRRSLLFYQNKSPIHSKGIRKWVEIARKKHPEWTDGHIKAHAIYMYFIEDIVKPYFKTAQVMCNRCVMKGNMFGGGKL